MFDVKKYDELVRKTDCTIESIRQFIIEAGGQVGQMEGETLQVLDNGQIVEIILLLPG